MKIEPWQVWQPGRNRLRVRARGLLCYWAVRELVVSMSDLSRRLGLSLAGVSKSVMRGEAIAIKEGHHLVQQ